MRPGAQRRGLGPLRELVSPQVYGVDHRGARVLIAPVIDAKRLPELPQRISDAVPVKQPDILTRTLSAPASTASLGILVWVIGSKLFDRLGLFSSEWMRGLMFLACMLILSYVNMLIGTGKAERRRQIPALTHGCLRRGICPGCGHALAGLESHSDGCVVCPECSAAWATASFASHAQFDAPPASDHPLRPRVVDVRGWGYPCGLRKPMASLEEEAGRVRSPLLPALSWELWIGPVVGPVVGVLMWIRQGDLGTALFGLFLSSAVLLGLGAYFFGKRLRSDKLARWSLGLIERGTCPCCEAKLSSADERLGVSLLCADCGGWWKAGRLPEIRRYSHG